MRRRLELEAHRTHRERHALPGQLGVMHAMVAQELGARPLEELEVGGMIDIAGKIRVLVIDADGKALGPCHRSTLWSVTALSRAATPASLPPYQTPPSSCRNLALCSAAVTMASTIGPSCSGIRSSNGPAASRLKSGSGTSRFRMATIRARTLSGSSDSKCSTCSCKSSHALSDQTSTGERSLSVSHASANSSTVRCEKSTSGAVASRAAYRFRVPASS